MEHGVPDSAIALAQSCPGWWCEALGGFALHVKGDVAAAESSFAAALTHMPRTERCSWNNLSPILEPADRDRYQGLDCDGRDSANAGLFWRATPLFSRPGNDARTEWYSRQIWIRALDNAITHHGMRLGGDFREMLLRYGWATAYGRRPDTHRPVEEIDVVGHEPKPAYPFLALDPQGNWPPAEERPKARFAPVFARYIAGLADVQLARFRRGDSLVVVTGFIARQDSLFHDEPTASLVLSPAPGVKAAEAREQLANGAGSASAAAAGPSHVASLEVEDVDHRAWAVLRTDPLERPERISDLLFTDRGDQLPENLAHAISISRSGSRVREGSIIGLYWETYDHEPSDSAIAVSLTVETVRPGFLGRVGQSLGLKRRTPPLRLAWTRPLDATASMAAHAVELDLSRLKPGSYLLRVEMGEKREAERPFEIVGSDRIAAAVRFVPGSDSPRWRDTPGLSAVALPPQPRVMTASKNHCK